MRRLALLAPAAVLAVAAPAAHAAGWSPPTTVSGTPHTFVGPLAVPSSGGVVAWPWQDGVGASGTVGASVVGRTPATGFGPEHAAPTGLLDVGTYGSTRTLAIAETGARTQRLSYAYGRRDEGFSPARTLISGQILGRPQLAVAGNGRALIAWIQVTDGGRRRIVRISERSPGGSFRAPATLSGQGRADTLATTINDRGDAAVLFVRQGRLLVRVRRAGHSWGAITELAHGVGKTQWQLSAGSTIPGQIRLLWRRHQYRQDTRPGRTSLEGTYLSAGHKQFHPVQVLEDDGAAQARLVAVPDGWGVAYVQSTPDGPRPALRVTVNGGAFGAVRYAAPARGGIRTPDLAYDDAAGFIVAWVQPLPGGDGDGAIQAAEAVGSAPFGPVVDVSPAENAHEVRLIRSSAARTVAVWTARPEGTGPGIPLAQIHSVVRTATRVP
jgi:hypothetical protein